MAIIACCCTDPSYLLRHCCRGLPDISTVHCSLTGSVSTRNLEWIDGNHSHFVDRGCSGGLNIELTRETFNADTFGFVPAIDCYEDGRVSAFGGSVPDLKCVLCSYTVQGIDFFGNLITYTHRVYFGGLSLGCRVVDGESVLFGGLALLLTVDHYPDGLGDTESESPPVVHWSSTSFTVTALTLVSCNPLHIVGTIEVSDGSVDHTTTFNIEVTE